jgi:alanine-glyoxylate transaminase/serine-glyoxylate transaminase/serine-pyruvate transaminase
MVAPRVYEAMAQPIVGHLDPFFFEIFEQVRSLLGTVFSTINDFNLPLSGTGSSGMEAAVANFVEPGTKFALLTNGYFGDRIGEMARRHGAEVIPLAKPWGEAFDPQETRDFIRRERPAIAAFVQAETSTGMFNDARPVTEAAREVGALTIADCVTSLGGMPVLVDDNEIDVAYSCSQKGLSCPPGLAPITVSPHALERLKQRTAPCQSWYLDLRLLEEYYFGHKYHHTASATLLYAIREGLSLIAEEGIENCWERHHRNHVAFVAGIEAMGLRMLVPEGRRLWTLNTPRVPDGVNDAEVRRYLLNRRGIEIAGGFGPLAGKVFRIGFMGHGSRVENVLLVLEALTEALRKQGFEPAGDGPAAAQKAMSAFTEA